VIADWAATAMFVVFVVAVAAKLRSASAFDDFAGSLSQFGISSITAQWWTAAAVLLLEAIASAGLLLAHHPVARFALPVALLLGFSAGVALASRGGRASACHCFGTSTELPTGPHLSLNGALAVLGIVAVWADDPSGSTGDSVLGIGLGVITGVLFVCAAELYAALSVGASASVRGAVAEKVG
jgi:methylamine utilization protein MauE